MSRTTLRLTRSNTYAQYYLSRNPFPFVSIPEEEPSVYFDQEVAISRISSSLKSAIETGYSNHIVLVGPYGTGKSHTLKHIAHLLNEGVIAKRGKSQAVYIPHPGGSFADIYKQVVLRLGYSEIRRLGSQVGDSNVLEQEVHRAIKLMNEKSNLSLNAWRWLSAEKLEISTRNAINVGANVDEGRAADIFKQLLVLRRKEGTQLFCLLIDEFETVNELNPIRKQHLYNTLRHVIDDNPRGLCLVLACSPAGWDELLENAYALARRVSRNVVYLDNLNEAKLGQVIAGYLQTTRTSEGPIRALLKERKVDPSKIDEYIKLYPFSPAILSELLRLSQGNIGEVIKFCNVCIEKAALQGVPYIDERAFQQLTEEYQK